MKDKILKTASDLFLNFGFKSVTMDDIAHKIGISKKTIYQHYANKTKLVEATTMHTFNMINRGIDEICTLNKNPIEEIYEIKRFIMNLLKDEKSSPQFQLQKYYPKIYANLHQMHWEAMNTCVIGNLSRGISQKFFRASIDINFISILYFHNMILIKNQDLFSNKQFSINTLMYNYLEYHIRGICTPSGLEILNSIIDKNKTNE